MERLQTGQDRSSTSKVSRLNTVPAGQRYAMVMPSYFSSLSRFNAKKPSPYHHDMQGKTILAFSRIVQNCINTGSLKMGDFLLGIQREKMAFGSVFFVSRAVARGSETLKRVPQQIWCQKNATFSSCPFWYIYTQSLTTMPIPHMYWAISYIAN